MKTLIIGMLALCLVGCKEKRPDSMLEAGRDKMLRQAIADRDAAEVENRELHIENQRLRLEINAAKGKIMVMEAKVTSAVSKVENAYKLGWSARTLELLETGK